MKFSVLSEERILAAKKYQAGGYETLGEALPTIEGLAEHLGISRQTLYEHAETSEEVADILDRIRTKQAAVLINGGLRGDFNAAIAKLLLNKHGYSEKQSIDHDIHQKNDFVPQVIELVAVSPKQREKDAVE